MKTKGYKRTATAARRKLPQHIVAIAGSPLGRELALAAFTAIATAITAADERHGVLKTAGRNLRQAMADKLRPLVEEIVQAGRQRRAAAAD